MYFDIQYDNSRFTDLVISPDENENPDLLHDYATSLKIKNTATTFTKLAKAGKLNDMSDKDYEIALQNIKKVSAFFDNKPEANVFHVLAEAIKFILSREKPEQELPCDDDDEDIDF